MTQLTSITVKFLHRLYYISDFADDTVSRSTYMFVLELLTPSHHPQQTECGLFTKYVA